MERQQRVDEILEFWFGAGDDAGGGRRVWFVPDPAFDQACTTGFLADHELADAGGLNDWRNEARSALALILLLDQFPRNMFRGAARAFATDHKALALAKHAVAGQFELALREIERAFVSKSRHDRIPGVCRAASGSHSPLRPLSASQRDPRPLLDARGDEVHRGRCGVEMSVRRGVKCGLGRRLRIRWRNSLTVRGTATDWVRRSRESRQASPHRQRLRLERPRQERPLVARPFRASSLQASSLEDRPVWVPQAASPAPARPRRSELSASPVGNAAPPTMSIP
jgi:hypothetical protein